MLSDPQLSERFHLLRRIVDYSLRAFGHATGACPLCACPGPRVRCDSSHSENQTNLAFNDSVTTSPIGLSQEYLG